MLLRRVANTRSRALVCSRAFSQAPPGDEITPAEIQENLEKVESHKKFLQHTSVPAGFGEDIVPMGKDDIPPENIAELSVLSGMPEAQKSRTVTIAPFPKKTLQYSNQYSHQWILKWKRERSRWANPLMGWTASGDPMSSVQLRFDSADEAITFAKKNGWNFEVAPAQSKYVMPEGEHSYADNFLPRKTMIEVKKQGLRNNVFSNDDYGASNWFMPLKYHGDGEVEQFGPDKKK